MSGVLKVGVVRVFEKKLNLFPKPTKIGKQIFYLILGK